MSRIPQPSSRGNNLKVDPPSRGTPIRSRVNSSVGTKTPRTPRTPGTPVSPGPATKTASGNGLVAPSSRARTISKPASPVKATNPRSPTPGKSVTPKRVASPTKRAESLQKEASGSSKPQLSIREQIALKRAEVKKAQRSVAASPSETLEDAVPDAPPPVEEDILGRLSLRETIERARSTGSLNIVARSLPCIPSALFEIHLGLTPAPLKSVPEEPPLPLALPRKGKPADQEPAWFEGQDLQVLKAFNNDIIEIQPELSLFGSLKVLDIHANKIAELPLSVCDLMTLSTLDVSHNCLTQLPPDLFSLPELTVLNVSHNSLTSLHFNEPFATGYKPAQRPDNDSVLICDIPRSTVPLPRLVTLDASHNKITAGNIDLPLPSTLIKADFSSNPVGSDQACKDLLASAARLNKLKEFHFELAEIGDEVFVDNVFPAGSFPSLQLFDLRETRASQEAVRNSLAHLEKDLSFDFVSEDPPPGVIRVLVGKQIIREAWEIEAERRQKARTAHLAKPAEDEEARTPGSKPAPKPEIVKEHWEFEAENGLLTEGGRRRARAKELEEKEKERRAQEEKDKHVPPGGFALDKSKYYDDRTHALTLPPSAAPTHARAFSMAAPGLGSASSEDLKVPTATLPLSVIAAQSFAPTLRSLTLTSRRKDRVVTLPAWAPDTALLPVLEELELEGCNIGDTIPVARHDPTSQAPTSPGASEPVLPLLTRLFPSLRVLNLTYNLLTSAALTTPVLTSLILADNGRPGLRVLCLRGNRITDLEGFQGLSELFRGHREVPEWKLDELDLRDNEISRLPPEMGLLPLDVFLVEGNTFRAPQRRVWEREGTKGLLAWLRGRIE
ncbi:hypothetical protein HDZ31DRAFT_35493 [Schizophyllum fasciatum]